MLFQCCFCNCHSVGFHSWTCNKKSISWLFYFNYFSAAFIWFGPILLCLLVTLSSLHWSFLLSGSLNSRAVANHSQAFLVILIYSLVLQRTYNNMQCPYSLLWICIYLLAGCTSFYRCATLLFLLMDLFRLLCFYAEKAKVHSDGYYIAISSCGYILFAFKFLGSFFVFVFTIITDLMLW